MGCCSFRKLTLAAAIVSGLAYFLYTPFPPEASNHRTKALFGLLYRTIMTVGKVGSFLGFGSPINITRAILRSSTKLARSNNVEVTEAWMDGVRVLVHRPKSKTSDPLPGLVYFHGGGWIIMSADTYQMVCAFLSEVTNSVVVSVDYRLAPEHVFPAAIDDCIRAARYFLKHATEFGVDPARVGVAGDSAGGNLAMATALNLSLADDKSLPTLKLQLLVYPALQMLDLNLPSYVTHGDGPGLLRKGQMIDFYLNYLFGDTSLHKTVAANKHTSQALKKSKFASYVSKELLPEQLRSKATPGLLEDIEDKELLARIEEKILNPMFSPLMATDEQMSKMPPAYIMIAEFDVLRDDGFLAAARLERSGVPVSTDYLRSEEHGFISLRNQLEVIEAFSKFAQYFQERMKM